MAFKRYGVSLDTVFLRDGLDRIPHIAFQIMKKYLILILFILLFSFLLRVYHFNNRVFIFGDGARDILVARGALENHVIPQVASFSSAGPFVFGPHYYWILMAIYMLNPQSWNIFYYFLILQSIFLVFILIKIGEMIWNKKFGLILGLLAAVSPRLIYRSMGMTQHTIVAICSALALYFFVKFVKERKSLFSAATGFWTAIAIMMHYQALGLLVMLSGFLIIPKKIINKLKNVGVYLLGSILPCISFILWDASQNFANFRNLLDYFLIGQNRIYIANRWSWHILKFWPGYIADLFGGEVIIGGVILYFSLFLCAFLLLRGKLKTVIKYLFFYFVFYYIYLRFYKGEKFEGYLAYLQPLTFVIIGYGLYHLAKFKKIFYLLMTICFFTSILSTKNYFMSLKVNQFEELKKIEMTLEKETHAKKFAVYDFANDKNQTETWDISDSLTVFLGSQNKLDFKNGYKLGVCQSYCPKENLKEIDNSYFQSGHKHLLLIGSSHEKFNLVERSPKAVMEELLYWWKARPLKSPFNLGKYILERIPVVNKLVK